MSVRQGFNNIWIYANVGPLTTHRVRYVIDQAELFVAFWQPAIEHLRPVCPWLIYKVNPATIDWFNFAYLLLLRS